MFCMELKKVVIPLNCSIPEVVCRTESRCSADWEINPLLHYILYGADQGRDPSPNVHSKWYGINDEDVADAGLNPLQHYMEYGRLEGRRAHKYDDDALVRSFLKQNETVEAARLFATMGPAFDDPIKVIVCPLTDLHTYAENAGKIIANPTEIAFLTGAANRDSESRLNFRASSRSRPSPYLAELSEVMMLPGSSLIIDRSGRALDDELDFAVRRFQIASPNAATFSATPTASF